VHHRATTLIPVYGVPLWRSGRETGPAECLRDHGCTQGGRLAQERRRCASDAGAEVRSRGGFVCARRVHGRPGFLGAALRRLVRQVARHAALLGMTGCIRGGLPLRGKPRKQSPSPGGPTKVWRRADLSWRARTSQGRRPGRQIDPCASASRTGLLTFCVCADLTAPVAPRRAATRPNLSACEMLLRRVGSNVPLAGSGHCVRRYVEALS
jgi:hypothetical protein